MMISDSELLSLNKRGLFPGPGESEERFLDRIANIERMKKEESFDEPLLEKDWSKARTLSQSLFDIQVDWVQAFYSDKKLPLWQGAAVWIREDAENLKVPALQLKKSFRKGTYLKIYSQEEVLAHESVHAARMAFDEPKFEELLAYLTSQSPFRKMAGPIFRVSWESYLFVILLALPVLVQGALFFMEDGVLLDILFWSPCALMLLGIARLTFTKQTFKRCLKRCRTIVKNPQHVLPFIFRLTDEEIVLFSRLDAKQIESYIHREKQRSLRWRLLVLAYC